MLSSFSGMIVLKIFFVKRFHSTSQLLLTVTSVECYQEKCLKVNNIKTTFNKSFKVIKLESVMFMKKLQITIKSLKQKNWHVTFGNSLFKT